MVSERFWSKVDVRGPNECWEWKAAKIRFGYGVFRLNGKQKKAHRVSYAIANGEIPTGIILLHSCDNTSCVNPSHLVPGTHKENTRDMVSKGRNGKNMGKKLSVSDVMDVKKRLRSGETVSSISRRYGVTMTLVSHISSGKTWTKIPCPVD